MAEEKMRCAGTVWRGWYDYPCTKPAKYHEGGKDWCGIHLPSRVKAKQASATAKWNAEWAAKERARDHEKKLTAAREAVIQAAKAWCVGIAPRLSYDSGEEQALDEAVAALNQLENDNGTD